MARIPAMVLSLACIVDNGEIAFPQAGQYLTFSGTIVPHFGQNTSRITGAPQCGHTFAASETICPHSLQFIRAITYIVISDCQSYDKIFIIRRIRGVIFRTGT